MPVARYTVASGGTGRGAVTGSSPHAIITATPASPIHLVARIALSHVGRFPPHAAEVMDGPCAGASDQWPGPAWYSRAPAGRTGVVADLVHDLARASPAERLPALAALE